MKCPTDNETLQLSERHGIEIDYCPTCRGVWLDRGELDKILDAYGSDRPDRRRSNSYDDGWDDDSYERVGSGKPKRKRKGLLGELFEFGE